MKVMIDPGHGGHDPGRVATFSTGSSLKSRRTVEYKEAEAAWAVAVLTVAELERDGHNVRMTRAQSEYVSPGGRARLANAWGADVFVSIHFNGWHTTKANGFETLHYGAGSGGYDLAQQINFQASCMLHTPVLMNPRGLKARPGLIVLRDTDMPACLTEWGFMSNLDDVSLIADHHMQAGMARSICQGVRSYLEER